MKLKKIIIHINLLLIIIGVSILLNKVNVDASTDYDYITTTSGNLLTYRGTSIKVEVPKYEQQSTEFRGVWVSPYAGDISGFKQTKEICQKELLAVLENMEKFNLNAIVFHIRTHNDAYYNTKLAPKSNYISAANFNQWDYLSWFIEECHKRGIEFHAWLNPYRIASTGTTMDQIKQKYDKFRNNPAYKEENVLLAPTGAILDPGRPAVKKYLVEVCMEIIRKYDIDAIHFDDYFYMQGIDDSKTYQLYSKDYGNVSISNFRRLQIDEFIETLSKEMYEYNIKNNKCIQLGISPSGVYRNGSYSNNYVYDDNGTLISPLSSNTAGYAHYDSPLYSDTKKWIDEEWIDYITPQLYGSFENTGMPYADTLDWWAHVVRNKKVNLYTGIGIYQANGTSDKGWYTKGNPTLELSLRYNQKHKEVDGFCLYQYNTLKHTAYSNSDFKNVFENLLTNKANTPTIPRYSSTVGKASNLKLIKGNDTVSLLFDSANNATKYAIYRQEGINSKIDVNDPNQLIGIIGNTDFNVFKMNVGSNDYVYGVVAINQANQKSDVVSITGDKVTTEIDFDFAKFNKIEIIGNIVSGGSFYLSFDRATVYVGTDVTYKIYCSYDKQNWDLIGDIRPFDSDETRIRLKFNECLHPTYYQIVIENEFGEIRSEIVEVFFRQLKLEEVMDYILSTVNGSILDILKDE